MAEKKVLAVDDSATIRTSISFVLKQAGYEVVEAVSYTHLRAHET